MPRGHKTIDWTPANDAKLLLTIVAVENIHPNFERVATAFDVPGVNATAIQSRMAKLRQKAKDVGAAPGNGLVSHAKSTAKRALAPHNKKAKPRKPFGGMLSGALSDDESMDLKDDTDAEQEATPPDTDCCDAAPKTLNASSKLQKTIGGRVTKPRVSPRKSTKKDYKALEDPFVAMNGTIDGDGENVFDTDKSDSEDTYASDAESTNGRVQEANIKMEEAV